MEKIEINHLPNQTGSIEVELDYALTFSILTPILPFVFLLAGIGFEFLPYLMTACIVIVSVLWYRFYMGFADGCSSLNDGVGRLFTIFAYLTLASGVVPIVGVIAFINDMPYITLACYCVSGIIGLVNLIIYIMAGVKLRRAYSGRLGSVGTSMLISLPAIVALVLIDIFAEITLVRIISVITILYYMYTRVWKPMYQLIEEGFFVMKEA